MLNNLVYSFFEVKFLECIPDFASCTICKTVCKRNSKGSRKPIDIDLNHPVILFVSVGVYYCPKCNRYFRIQPSFISKGAHYTDRAKSKAIVSVKDDQMPFSRIPFRLSRDFNISPVKSSIWNWFYNHAKQLDLFQDYEQWVSSSFSGVVCIDEVYDKQFCVIFATDPLNNKTIAFQLNEGDVDKEQMKNFLEYLKSIGINPDVIVSDGSVLYPDNIKDSFPNAKHLLCNFHFIRNFCKDTSKAILSYSKSLPKKPEQKILDNIPTSTKPKLSSITGFSDKQLISRNRHLFSTRPENLSKEKRDFLDSLLSEHPKLQLYRDFILDIFNLYDLPLKVDMKDFRTHIINNPLYIQDKHLSKAINRLSDNKKFNKSVVFLDYLNLNSTNNDAERAARFFRKRQKSHYRIRTFETIKLMLTSELFRQKEIKEQNSNIKLAKLQKIQSFPLQQVA